MTGWRGSIAIKFESEYGKEDNTASWKYLGIGVNFTYNEKNGWRFQNGMGSKVPEFVSEGRYGGTWSVDLYADYNNFMPLRMAFEDYAYVTDSNGRGVHIFTTSNSKSLKSSTIKVNKLNKAVGGKLDEALILLGCVVNRATISFESNNSAVKLSLSGVFADSSLVCNDISDIVAYDSSTKVNVRPFEWGCLKLMNDNETKWESVANNEKASLTFSRTVTTIPECGTRIDTAFYESNVQPISVSTTVYSRNPNQWHTRMHKGGKRNDLTSSSPASKPLTKGLKAIPKMRIESGAEDNGKSYACIVALQDIVLEGFGYSINAGSEIVENPTLNAGSGMIVIKTPDVVSEEDETGVIVEFDYNDGATSSLTEYTVVGGKVILPNPTTSGFVKWERSSTAYSGGETVTITESMLQGESRLVKFVADYGSAQS